MAHPHPAAHPPPPPVKPKRKKWPWVLLAVFAAIIALFSACVAAVDDAVKESTKPVTLVYEVTGDAKDVVITYTTWSGGSFSTSQETAATLPWTKQLQAEGFGKGGQLTAITGAEGGNVACKVTIDGGPPKQATASGQFATASCSGF